MGHNFTLNDNAGMLLEAMGITNTPENREQCAVLLEALALYDQRSQKNGQAWRRYGALNNVLRLGIKAERLVQQLWMRKHPQDGDRTKDVDDALDAINYAVFVIRQARLGEWSKEDVEYD